MLRNSALLALRRATRGLAASHHHVAVQRHAAALHKADPDRWTERALARHFELPLDTLQALLALQALEETENNAGDAELGALADDIEEYVVEAADEVDLRGGGSGAGAAYLLPDVASGTLGAMEALDAAQEAALVSHAATALGLVGGEAPRRAQHAAHDALRDALGAVGDDELVAMRDELRGTEGGAAGGRSELLRELLQQLAPGAPAATAEAAADGDGLAGYAEGEARAEGDADGDGAAGAAWARADDGVIDVGVLAGPGRSAPGTHHFLVRDDVGPDAESYIPADELRKLRTIRAPERADLLAKNLAYRARELALRGPSSSAKFTPPRTNTGTLVFTEIGGAKDEPPRVWVSRKGEPDAEEADAETARRHRLIARPPALLPRVKRNY